MYLTYDTIKRFIYLLLLFGVSLMLTGCIKMSITEKVDSSGNSTITILQEYDREAIEQAETEGGAIDVNSLCENPPLSKEVYYNSHCEEIDEYSSRITAGRKHSSEVFFQRGPGEYVFKLTALEDTIEAIEQGDEDSGEDLTLEEIQQGNALMRDMGISATYTVTLPFPIASSDIGTISGNNLEIDLYSFQEAIFQNPDLEVVLSSSDSFSGEADNRSFTQESSPITESKLPSTGGRATAVILFFVLISFVAFFIKKRA